MKTGLLKAALVALVLAAGSIALWIAMDRYADEQFARIAEAESYAARSQLVRNVDAMLAALRNVRTYWQAFGHLPQERWWSEAAAELERFDGVEAILWDDPGREVRYLRTPDRLSFGYRPGDEEWASYADLLQTARSSDGSTIVGPVADGQGDSRMTVVIAGSDAGSGRLAAVVNVDSLLDGFLQDEPPDFAVRIFADDQLIYERGEADPDASAAWVGSGFIQLSFGSLWRVVHSPTSQMLESHRSGATDLTLLLGLIVAVLMGTLVFENGRARDRAYAAEMAEARVSEMNRNLEALVAERTQELSARTADVQTLTDSVGHDLRNPLNVLAINIELLEDSLDRPDDAGDRQEALARMSPCIDQMTDVLDRLIGLSTVANSTFEREHVDMQAMIEDIVEDVAATEPPPPVELDIGELPAAHADPTLTRVLLLNLIGNAFKYTRGREQRRVQIGHEVRAGDVVYFIADNGVGFDRDQAEQIFTAFTRLEDNIDRNGIGLGLALVKKVIARHEGRIWADSEPGEGATFFFVLSPSNPEQTNTRQMVFATKEHETEVDK